MTAKTASLGPKQPVQCPLQGVSDTDASKIDRAAMRTPRQKSRVIEPHFERSLPQDGSRPGIRHALFALMDRSLPDVGLSQGSDGDPGANRKRCNPKADCSS